MNTSANRGWNFEAESTHLFVDELLPSSSLPSKPLETTSDVLLALLFGEADGEDDNATVVLGDVGELVAGVVDCKVVD